MGAAYAKLLISKSAILPSNILLPNLLDPRQASYSQKILYRGLLNQCFCCFGFGHLAKNCLKLTKDNDKHIPNMTIIVPYQDRSYGWIEVGHKKTSSHVSPNKPQHVTINTLKEFPPLQNRYTALHVEEDCSHKLNTLDQSSSYLPQ